MIPVAHRLFSAAAGHAILESGGDTIIYTPQWEPMTGPQPATVRVCAVPGIGHARAFSIGSGDPNDESTYTASPHLTLFDIPRLIGTPMVRPRYLYVAGPPDLLASVIPQIPYNPLRALGVQVAMGAIEAGSANNGAAKFGIRDIRNAGRPHLMVLPVEDASRVETYYDVHAMNPQQPGWFITDDMLTYETQDYSAGEVYVAVLDADINEADGGGTNTKFTVFGSYARLLDTSYSWNALSGDPDYLIIPDGRFTALETQSATTTIGVNGRVTLRYRLIVNTALIAQDAADLDSHIARYENFRQVYYHPDTPYTVPTPPGLTFSTSPETVFGMIASGPVLGSVPYVAGDPAALAARIVADAISFFS